MGDFRPKTGGLESLQFILRTILVIAFHKLHQQHSERLSLRSSETKRHRHLNIKAFTFLNPCPKLIDVMIWIKIKRIPQIPVNTFVCSNVQKCTQKSVRKRLNPLLMPHISQAKATKCANPPHTRDAKSCQYGDKTPLKPHIHTYIRTYIFCWCLIHRTSTLFQINLQLTIF